jgi:3-keto-L-gulonate-6-phosphate decarboxylase
MTRPLVQLALDLTDLDDALAIATAAGDTVDILEAGTVLCLARGLDAVRALRAAFPEKPIVADLRIARAGGRFATMAFEAGANHVTVVGEAPRDVVLAAIAAAREAGGSVEAELPPVWDDCDVRDLVQAGVGTIVAHRFTGAPLSEDLETQRTLQRLASMELGPARITLAGALGTMDLAAIPFGSVDVVAVGSGITGAQDPARAAQAYRAVLDKIAEAACLAST